MIAKALNLTLILIVLIWAMFFLKSIPEASPFLSGMRLLIPKNSINIPSSADFLSIKKPETLTGLYRVEGSKDGIVSFYEERLLGEGYKRVLKEGQKIIYEKSNQKIKLEILKEENGFVEYTVEIT